MFDMSFTVRYAPPLWNFEGEIEEKERCFYPIKWLEKDINPHARGPSPLRLSYIIFLLFTVEQEEASIWEWEEREENSNEFIKDFFYIISFFIPFLWIVAQGLGKLRVGMMYHLGSLSPPDLTETFWNTFWRLISFIGNSTIHIYIFFKSRFCF